MPKLNLKRTPQEEVDRQRRKKRRREPKRELKSPKASASASGSPPEPSRRQWDSDDASDASDVYGPHPTEAGPSSRRPPHSESDQHYPESSYKPDYEAIRAELEEARFREKMMDAFADDDRLDTVETRMNEYAHVPDRWKSGRGARGAEYAHAAAADDDIFKLDPRYMDEEEYAEWIRAGMYRKTHAQEYEEERLRKAAREARRAHDKAVKAETARLAQIAEDERKRKKLEKEIRRGDYAREEYHTRWKVLLAIPPSDSDRKHSLSFSDIPWPILAAYRNHKRDKNGHGHGASTSPPAVSIDDLTVDAVAAFLIPSSANSAPGDTGRKYRKEKLRETFLRFHPDKFEGRFMNLVREEYQGQVREASGVVVRALNALMGEDK